MEIMKLNMPTQETDITNGINDGNIETYKNTLMLSLTKEELQNSTDAVIKENGTPKKVGVQFHWFDLDNTQIPDYEHLKEVFNDEVDYWEKYKKNDKKDVKILKRAKEILASNSNRCLRISDYNTTGLVGIGEPSSAWTNLVKNRGVSDKEGSASGSFGIGKDAAFACSALRLVFYNTVNIEKKKAFEGVLKLPSYQKGDNNYIGTGFICDVNSTMKESSPVLDSISLDENYTRKNEPGMDKFILGCLDGITDEELCEGIIVSSLDNFLFAFFTDRLEVFCGKEHIYQTRLDYLFDKYASKLNEYTIDYYKTLKEPQMKFSISLFEDNDIDYYLRLDPNGKRKAAVVRQSGMKVFDMNRIEARIPFSAVIHLKGDKVNKYFKKLENAEHTRWAFDRADNKKEAEEKYKFIKRSLAEKIRILFNENYEESTDAEGASEYLPYTYVTGKKNSHEGLSNEVDDIKKAPKKKKKDKKKKENTDLTPDEEGVDVPIVDDNLVPSDVDPNPVPSPQPGQEPAIDPEGEDVISVSNGTETDTKFISKREISTEQYSVFLTCHNNEYKLKLKPLININKGFVSVYISGEDNTLVSKVNTASINGTNVDVRKNKISFVDLKKEEITEIKFTTNNLNELALEVELHES